ncbi:hypothetical protein [Thermogemmatispora sp.]|jgi:hypothetical protein|uniref:hypothetical protein n=1 Tax=Thermogemmatispora sp. TaxID=1968838 RepID=UPI00257EEE52|nr:hypothetical protein [Thermogemmatispora sp.]
MMYLPETLPDARVLIAVKAYPLPSNKYEELVCTAGVLENGKWIRIYPIPFRSLPYDRQYRKFEWIRLSLVKNVKDFRPESYRPLRHLEEPIFLDGHISASSKGWRERKSYVLREVFDSMSEIIGLAKGPQLRSLAVLKPREIIDFRIEPTSRCWKQKWNDYFLQSNLLDIDSTGEVKRRVPIRKLPYKYSYVFMSKGDTNPRKLFIEDWELGALYWNCLTEAQGDEAEANRLVRQKYLDEFCSTRDIYLFLGTTWQYHRISPNPFIIIGVFYPPKQSQRQKTAPIQLSLF